MKELEKKELNATELENKDLEKVNGGAGHYYLAVRQEREEAERKAQWEKEHSGKAEGTW